MNGSCTHRRHNIRQAISYTIFSKQDTLPPLMNDAPPLIVIRQTNCNELVSSFFFFNPLVRFNSSVSHQYMMINYIHFSFLFSPFLSFFFFLKIFLFFLKLKPNLVGEPAKKDDDCLPGPYRVSAGTRWNIP